MSSDYEFDHLNKTLGYEIARILIDSTLRFTEIKEELPYDADDKQIWRILNDGVEKGIFEIPPTIGGKKYTLNSSIFSQDELDEIRFRAKTRIRNEPPHADGPRTPSVYTQDHS